MGPLAKRQGREQGGRSSRVLRVLTLRGPTAPQVLPEYKWMLNETKPVRDDGVFHLWVPEGRLQLGVKVSEYSRGTLAVPASGAFGSGTTAY